ncbi:hypothetical protein D9M68_680650 [compost metagenome]
MISFDKPNELSVCTTKDKASYNGIPILSENSKGAAPVPPSAPSTAIKSGIIPLIFMASHILINSCLFPIHNLKPIGFPSDSVLKKSINRSISIASEKALCAGGE